MFVWVFDMQPRYPASRVETYALILANVSVSFEWLLYVLGCARVTFAKRFWNHPLELGIPDSVTSTLSWMCCWYDVPIKDCVDMWLSLNAKIGLVLY